MKKHGAKVVKRKMSDKRLANLLDEYVSAGKLMDALERKREAIHKKLAK